MGHDECCLFHGKKHRSEFQFILNFLRKNCETLKIDFSRAAPLVCCCKLDSDKSCLKLLPGKDTPTKGQSSEGEVGKPQDKDSCKKEDGVLESVLKMNMIPGKVQVILEKWIKRNPDAESHVHHGNSRIGGLMMLCLKGNKTPLLKMMVESGTREHVVTVPLPHKLVKPFFELDMTEMQKFDFKFEVLDSPLAGLSVNETLLKVTCDKESLQDVTVLLVKEAEELVTKEKNEAMRLLNESGSETTSTEMSKAAESHQMMNAMLKNKKKRMRMT